MIRLALLLVWAAGAAIAAAPGHGLIENRTGLPLVFPLQVETTSGRDAYLVLRDAGTGEIAVTAYVEGGRFFRLLMPPGTYILTAALGRGWKGRDELFGEETRLFELPQPLTFEVQGIGRKQGHIVDLRGLDEMAGVTVRSLAFCQDFAGVVAPPPPPPERSAAPRSVAPEIPFSYPLPPGPRDPALDARPELGLDFGNSVEDVPLWLRLGEGRVPARAAAPPGPAGRAGSGFSERLCS